jgi:hypothetical protein
VVPPGKYTLTLHAGGETRSATLVVRNDPRSPATTADLLAQSAFTTRITSGIRASWDGAQRAITLRTLVSTSRSPGATSTVGAAAAQLIARLDSLIGTASRSGGVSFQSVNGSLASQLMAQDNADHAPTPAMRAAYVASLAELSAVNAKWDVVRTRDLAALNALLAAAGRATLTVPQ